MFKDINMLAPHIRLIEELQTKPTLGQNSALESTKQLMTHLTNAGITDPVKQLVLVHRVAESLGCTAQLESYRAFRNPAQVSEAILLMLGILHQRNQRRSAAPTGGMPPPGC